MPTALKGRRWRCPHCAIFGWSHDGRVPPHNNLYAQPCRGHVMTMEYDPKRGMIEKESAYASFRKGARRA